MALTHPTCPPRPRLRAVLGVGVRVGDPGHPLKEPGRVCGQSRGTLVTAGARWWPQAPPGSELQRGLWRCGARPRLRAAPVTARAQPPVRARAEPVEGGPQPVTASSPGPGCVSDPQRAQGTRRSHPTGICLQSSVPPGACGHGGDSCGSARLVPPPGRGSQPAGSVSLAES